MHDDYQQNISSLNQQKKSKSNVDNNKLVSSLKFYDFEGMTKEDIISKFDSLLEQREKLINEINNDNCILNEKLNLSNSYVKQIEGEKNELMIKCNKLEKLFKQELIDKEILLTKNSKLEQENIHLLKNFEMNTKGPNKGGLSGFFQDISDKFSTKKPSNQIIETNNIITSKIKEDKIIKTEDTQKEINVAKKSESIKLSTDNSEFKINEMKKSNKNSDQEFGMLGSDNIEYEPLFD